MNNNLTYSMLIDTHCHLDSEFYIQDIDSIISKSINSGIKYFINPASHYSNWNYMISLSKKYQNIKICFGLHPAFINKHQKIHLNKVYDYSKYYNTNIIGEIGLDKRFDNFDKQLLFFKEQVLIAKSLDKKLIIHSVKSHNEIIKTLKDLKYQNGGIIHAFNANSNIANQYISMNFKIGVGGIISYPNSKLKNSLINISLDNIVLETDSPDMKLYGSDDKLNYPYKIKDILEKLEIIYNKNTDIIIDVIYKNSLEFI